MEKSRKTEIERSFHNSEIMKLYRAHGKVTSKGSFEISVVKQPFMMRPAGMFNGSTIASLIDVSSGYAAASANDTNCYLTTVDLKVNYLSPAIGDKLIAKANVVKNGKRIIVARSDVFVISNDGELHVATSLVTLMQLQNKNNETQID
ncbi:PaaI family thioesterase [Roseivirga seohaensis]|uniref:PaaI family thioesterase n=1 Tax=Roseivirga seohaensis TaxID=1914963 RepID=UPI003BA86B05